MPAPATPAAAGHLGLTPYITVRDAAAAIKFYKKAFGATELFRLNEPGGKRIGHAELAVSGGLLMLSDAFPDFGALAPEALGGSPVKLHLDVKDAEAVFASAVKAGATVLRKLELQFHGCKQGLLADPFGHSWFVSEKVEEVTPQDMQRRWDAMAAGRG